MEIKTRTLAIIMLIIMLLASIDIVVSIVQDPLAIRTWMPIMVGLFLSSPLYIVIFKARRRNKEGDTSKAIKNTGSSPYRWLLPTIIVSIILGRVITSNLDEINLKMVEMMLTTFMVSFIGLMAIVVLLYTPKE